MTRRTDAAAGASCPVCAEPLPERPARCFRCETALGPWWEFEDALGGAAAAPGRRWLAVAAAGAVGVVLGIAVMAGRRPPPSSLIAATPPPPGPSAAPVVASASRVLTYRVQRGDSLWRVAAAFTGDGRRWRELWPEHQDEEGRIAAGTVLQVDLSRLPER